MMMMKLKFTKKALAAIPLPPSGKRVAVYDLEIPKLAMRITSNGSRAFYVIKRSGAAMAWIKLGTFPEMTVEQARSEAQKILAVFATGGNPAIARRATREEPTFAQILEEMLSRKKKRDGTSITERTKKDYRDTARLHMTSIKTSKLSEIRRTDVRAIHTKASKRSLRQADKAVAVISSVFNYAIDNEYFSGPNPASRIQKNSTPSRDRFVQAAELPYLFSAIAESGIGDFFLLSLLTGARRANVLSMAWRDLDLDTAVWRIETTKNGVPQNLPLTSEALSILRQRKAQAGKSPFVFPSSGKSGHLVEPKKAWASILARATARRIFDHLETESALSADERKIAESQLLESPAVVEARYRSLANSLNVDVSSCEMRDLRIHDLRRTLGSWQAKTGASLAIIGKSLNHKTHQATSIYARLDLDPVRNSINVATQAIMEAAGGRLK